VTEAESTRMVNTPVWRHDGVSTEDTSMYWFATFIKCQDVFLDVPWKWSISVQDFLVFDELTC